MSNLLAIRNGGKTDENGALRFLRRGSINGQGQVASGDMLVAQHGTPNKSVDIAIGDLVIAYQDYVYYTWIDALANLSIASNASGNPRIDAVVAYVDLTVVSSASNNNPGALKFIDVQGTPAGSPTAPSDSDIQTAIGAGNPFYRLANVALANGYSTVVNANITDKRSQYLIGSGTKYGFLIPGTPVVANDLGWNPIVPYGQTVTSLAAYAKIAPVGSNQTIQVYNITQAHVVGSVTITAGAQYAITTTITNPTLNAGDVLRIDVTAVGSTTGAADISTILF